MKTETKDTYYVSTDSGSHAEPYAFESLAEALEDFGAPRYVRTADDFVEWLERVGGYGFIERNGVRICEVTS